MPDIEIPCVQCREIFFFYRERARHFLPAKYDAAAAVCEMPFEESCCRRRCTEHDLRSFATIAESTTPFHSSQRSDDRCSAKIAMRPAARVLARVVRNCCEDHKAQIGIVILLCFY